MTDEERFDAEETKEEAKEEGDAEGHMFGVKHDDSESPEDQDYMKK